MLTRLLVATALSATATLALAQTAPAPAPTNPAPTTTTPGTAAPSARADRDYTAAMASRTTMSQAIETAERSGSAGTGGRAIDVEFERQDGDKPAHYSVKVVYPDGKLVEYGVKADDNTIYKTENQPFERYFTRLKPADFQAAKTSLKDAVALAERHVGMGARAVEAEVEKDGGTVLYEIEVRTTDAKREVHVDAAGQVVKG